MPYINDSAFDAAISWIITNGTALSLCSSEPANYAGIAAVQLAEDTSVTCGAAANGASSGRRTTVPACACVAGDDGTAADWALHNNSDTLVASGNLSGNVSITDTLTYNTDAFDITFPDAA